MRLLATYCNFNDGDSEKVREVIQSCYFTTLRRKLLSKADLDFYDFIITTLLTKNVVIVDTIGIKKKHNVQQEGKGVITVGNQITMLIQEEKLCA